jgi:hypothetical protein|tara:strand:+ start:387 stop:1412 length:1026 start_codon:yes stop_codon:yes gene_type:complete
MGFKRFDTGDIIVSNNAVASTMWTNNSPTLTAFFTSSVQVESSTKEYYYDVYQVDATDNAAQIQFAVAYCDKEGSGSTFFNALVTGSTPTRSNYGQYRTLVLGDENAQFVFGNATSSYFYAVNIERARYKESILPGITNLKLTKGGSSINLTDDSQLNTSAVFTDAGRRYNLVSGSSGNIYTGAEANGWTLASGSYGWLLPDIGVMLLNGEALDGAVVDGGILLNTTRSFDSGSLNQAKIIDAMNAGSSVGFTLNSDETLSSDFVFVRARNNEYNYSENPSFISGSTGVVIYPTFVDNPQTYITTVGLYNDNSELLAVAKLSRPLPKDFTKELLVRVKLDF